MFRTTKHRSLKSSQLARIADGDLRAVVGGMFGRPEVGPPAPAPMTPPIIFPPMPALPDRSFTVKPTAPSPFSVSTFSAGGTEQTPQHAVSASFDNGRVFAKAEVMTPAVPALPPMPRILGPSGPALQTHQVSGGVKFRF